MWVHSFDLRSGTAQVAAGPGAADAPHGDHTVPARRAGGQAQPAPGGGGARVDQGAPAVTRRCWHALIGSMCSAENSCKAAAGGHVGSVPPSGACLTLTFLVLLLCAGAVGERLPDRGAQVQQVHPRQRDPDARHGPGAHRPPCNVVHLSASCCCSDSMTWFDGRWRSPSCLTGYWSFVRAGCALLGGRRVGAAIHAHVGSRANGEGV